VDVDKTVETAREWGISVEDAGSTKDPRALRRERREAARKRTGEPNGSSGETEQEP
jgi:hypothetical protein